MAGESTDGSKPSRPILLPVAIAIVVLIAGIVVWRTFRPAVVPNRKNGPHKLTPAEARELVELKNVAIGFLENGGDERRRTNIVSPRGLKEAEKRFIEITEKLPDELLGWQNLAICRCLQLTDSKIDPALAESAINELLKRNEKSAVGHWLAAYVQSRGERFSEAIKSLQKGVEFESDNAWIRYALLQAVKRHNVEESRPAAQSALKGAYQLLPDNLVLMFEWLEAQAKVKDATIIETITHAKKTIAPFQTPTLESSGVDVLSLLDKAEQAAKDEQWGGLFVPIRQSLNMLRGTDAYRNDVILVKPDVDPAALDFIVYDFSPEFYKQNSPTTPPESAQIDVSFKTLPADQQLESFADVKDLAIVDFDLNGTLDFAVLRDQSLEVIGRSDVDQPWELLSKVAVPATMKGIIAGAARDLEKKKHSSKVHVEEDGKPERPIPSGTDNDWPEGPACHYHNADFVVFGDDGVWVIENVFDDQSQARVLRRVEQTDEFNKLAAVNLARFADFDHDSDLDLVLATENGISLWSNRGNLTFRDETRWSALPPSGLEFTTMAPVDWDRDVDIDVILGGPADGVVGYLENLRHGTFRWRTLDGPAPELKAAADIVVTEIDGNVSWDLLSAGKDGVRLAQTATPRAGHVNALKSTTIDDALLEHAVACDYDNDSQVDVLAWTDKQVRLYRGKRDGAFTDETAILPDVGNDVRLCRTSDLDNDGDLDLVVVTSAGIKVYSNEGGNVNNYFVIMAMGDKDNAGKGHHIGSLIEVKAGSQYQAQVITGQRVHFGLGKQKAVDVVRIVWTNGMPQDIMQPATRQNLCEFMTLKGSCPYLYTWTGEKYEFLTDLLWAAPLGLQFSDGTLAPSRPWEYLKIPGERLKVKDGKYQMQITEELWEAAYFDQVELIAIDHPANVEIYSNEKVGPAEIAEFKVHTVREPRRPVAARDQLGRDVLDTVSRRDEVYLKGFDQRLRQGLVDPHYLELDFGKLDNPRRIMLFLTGWIMPTDTSINVSLSQNPNVQGPQPPSVWVPTGDNQWKRAIDYMGFPGGKTKTIAVDLSGVFDTNDDRDPNDYRIQIRTSAEIYWDDVFFTVDEPAAQLEQTKLDLLSANLHYRGFSHRLKLNEHSPEVYRYDRVVTQPRWPPMGGRFTRYGDVTNLLTQTDDFHVVMASGDEMTLAFGAPKAENPEGWKRDFFLHNVGWDKDADLNTIYGQTVEPLPFVEMSRYPYSPNESYPDTPRHRAYLRDYQTREQDQVWFWRSIQCR